MKYHLASYNIAKSNFPMDDPRMQGFTDALDKVNAEAERSPGFIWRLKDESGNATNIDVYNDPHMLVNLSLWESAEDLKLYLYNGDHLSIFLRKKEWFEPMKSAHMVLWWVEAGTIPTAMQGKQKLDYLIEKGSSQEAFGFKAVYAPPG